MNDEKKDSLGLVHVNWTFSVEVTLSERFLRDIIITACEGGIGYWSQLESYDGPEIDEGRGLPLRIRVIEEERPDGCEYGKWMTLDTRKVAKAIGMLCKGEVEGLSANRRLNLVRIVLVEAADPSYADYDADDADNIVQLALLGAVVYG